MTDFKLILSQVNQTLSSLPDWNNLENFVSKFHDIWLKLGKRVQQELVQAKINEKETKYQSPRTLREKRYYTSLGEMVVKRRAYVTSDGLKVKMAQEQFPGSIEILDFFHLSEYVWAVAKAAYPNKEQKQRDWVKKEIGLKLNSNYSKNLSGKRLFKILRA